MKYSEIKLFQVVDTHFFQDENITYAPNSQTNNTQNDRLNLSIDF